MARLGLAGGLLVALLVSGVTAHAVDIEALKRDVARVREEIAKQDDVKLSPVNRVDETLFDKYGADQAITTHSGKLVVGGLIQVWYHHITNDRVGIVGAAPGNNLDPTPGAGAIPGTFFPEPEEVLDNDTFRVRRTELRFKFDITKNIFAKVMIDPSREANVTFSPVAANPNHNSIFTNPHLVDGSGQQRLDSIVPQLLQDAYIEFHDFVPHHDFRIGQFKPPAGEEASRDSGYLDFVDRSMVTAINNVRDIGLMMHGGWFYNPKEESIDDGRIQYWVGTFNGPDGTVLTDPEIVEGGNRSDDNNDKDICWRIQAEPIWSSKHWYGKMEVGYARTDGYRGESGAGFNPAQAINGINRERTAINRQSAWIWYRPNGPVKGWWFRGEWGSGRDRYSRRAPTELLGVGQSNPTPVSAQGWYFGTGYKVSQTPYADKLDKCGMLGKAFKNMEFVFRYEVYQNIAAEDLVNPNRHTDLFKTQAYTTGLNYYIKGYNARLQANYIWVDDPNTDPFRGLREVKNDMFVLNFQVQF